ncbi:MAG: zinc ribbon domain-containing protein [Rhodoferax sp.]|nr:zinc ribbon domain-containing protein [Rhodoferax sp.]
MSFLGNIFGGHGGGHHGSGHGGGHYEDPHRSSRYEVPYGNNVPPAAPSNAGVACPACRALNGTGARFCHQCGTSMAPIRCSQCNTTMAAGAKFCGQCGKVAA